MNSSHDAGKRDGWTSRTKRSDAGAKAMQVGVAWESEGKHGPGHVLAQIWRPLCLPVVPTDGQSDTHPCPLLPSSPSPSLCACDTPLSLTGSAMPACKSGAARHAAAEVSAFPKARGTVQSLADDIMLLVLAFLEVKDIIALRQVSGVVCGDSGKLCLTT